MSDKEELALVLKAVTSGISNCILWKNQEIKNRLIRDFGITPSALRQEFVGSVRAGTHTVKQKKEDRENFRDYYEYVYHFTIPLEGFPRGFYLELVLHEEDADCPVVAIVSAHDEKG